MSKVYFSDFRASSNNSLPKKMIKLIKAAGFDSINFQNKYVAIKCHFGEWGNLGHIRQQYFRYLCDYIKKSGGKPFLTDAGTLYVGQRNNAVNHLDCAYMNGFNPLCTGVHTIIADGLRGTDEKSISLAKYKHCSAPKIASAIAEADILISVSHCKGHEVAGYGGTLKNIGMGSGSKCGKMEMHSSGTPAISTNKCVGCGMCKKHCNHNGIKIVNKKAVICEENCLGCGYCFAYCAYGAINCKWDEASSIMNEKIAEYTMAALKDKTHFHINFVQDVQPDCDCKGYNDVPLIPDVGMFASFDPLALDQACVDAISEQPIFANSSAGFNALKGGCKQDGFFVENHSDKNALRYVHTNVDWEAGFSHAQDIGLGSRKYSKVIV